jgi:hypothetical protein
VYKSCTIIIDVTLSLEAHHIIINSVQDDSGAEKNIAHKSCRFYFIFQDIIVIFIFITVEA